MPTLNGRCVAGWLVNRCVERVIGARFNTIAPLATLAQARCPVLLHGAQDATVPLADAQRLMARRGATRTQLHVLDGGHEGFADPAAAETAVLDFLAQALGGSRPPKPRSAAAASRAD